MPNQRLFEKVEKALNADDWVTAKTLLEEVNDKWGTEARIYKGTVLALSAEINSYQDGMALT